MQKMLTQQGVLTITGLPGSGKTQTAHRLSSEYTEQGYLLKTVDDIATFDIESCLQDKEKHFCIFENIFEKTEDSSHVDKLLISLRLHTKPPGTSKHEIRRKVVLVFTSQKHNIAFGVGNLMDASLFSTRTVFDLSSIRFTGVEARNVFLMHWKQNKCKPPEESDLAFISEKGPNVAGFPLMCSLYFGTDHSTPCRQFFDYPIVYYRTIFDHIVKLNSSLFAYLVCVFLCDKVATSNVDDASDSGCTLDYLEGRETAGIRVTLPYKPYGELIAKLKQIVPSVNIEDVKRGIQRLDGIYVNEKSCTFVDDVMYDAFAYSLFKVNPVFVLENCSLRFLCGRLSGKIVSESHVDAQYYLCVTEELQDRVAIRLRHAVMDGKFKLALSHKLLVHESFVDKVFENVKLDCFDSLFDEGKHIVYWTIKSDSTPLVKKVMAQMNWLSGLKRRQCIEAAMSSGNQEYTRGIITKNQSVIDSCLFLAVELNSLCVAEYLLGSGASVLFVNWEGCNIFHVACINNFERMFETIIRSCNDEVLHKAIGTRDYKNRTPLTISLENGHKKIFNLLISVGAGRRLAAKDDPFLHLACAGGNKEVVDYLLRTFDVNSRDTSDVTPLMSAAGKGHESLIDHLISLGADPRLKDTRGDQAIHYACRGGNVSTVHKLIAVSDQNSPGRAGLTPVMIAASEGKDAIFQYLVDHKADLSLSDQQRNALIHHACKGGNYEIVKKVSASNVNVKGEQGRTPAMIAAANKHVEILDFLLSQNADLSEVDDNQNTVVNIGLSTGDPQMIEYIKRKVNINYQDDKGRTPLMIAALKGDEDSFIRLKDNTADLNIVDKGCNTVLHHACRGGSIGIVKSLVNPIDINMPGARRRTPLMFAASCGHLDLVKFFILEKADYTRSDEDGNSVLHHASYSGRVDLVEFLLNFFPMDARGENQWTPIMISVVCGHESLFKELLVKGADTSLKDKKGFTCSDLACIYDRENIFISLVSNESLQRSLELSALFGTENIFFSLLAVSYKSKITSLDINDKIFLKACHGGSLRIVQYILRHESPDINTRDSAGKNGVMIAAERGHAEIFKLLVKEKCRLTCVDIDGNNILHLALSGGNKEILELILSMKKNKYLDLDDEPSCIFAHWYAR